ncbi:hypothetical protein JXQ70_14945 [bacterium]|nr:hypothetical protein [bacterium]
MGIEHNIFKLLLKERQYLVPHGKIMVFGVQDIWFSYDQAIGMLEQAGYPYTAIPESERKQSTSFLIRAYFNDARTEFVHVEDLFKILGYQVCQTMDVIARESPQFVHDLNKPVDRLMHGNYQTVYDGGVIEHVFNLHMGLQNIHDLLEPGGTIVHHTPLAGCLDHSFFYLNPCFFYDTYGENGYTDMKAFFVEQPHALDFRRLANPNTRYRFTEYTYGEAYNFIPRNAYNPLDFIFFARKPDQHKPFQYGLQGLFRTIIEPKSDAEIRLPRPRWWTIIRTMVRAIDRYVPASCLFWWRVITLRAPKRNKQFRL